MRKRNICFAVAVTLVVSTSVLVYLFLNPPPDDPLQHKFLVAARHGDLPKMERLFAAGARIGEPVTYDGQNFIRGPAIVEAIHLEHPAVVRWLLDHGVDPDQLIMTDTPLDIAGYELKRRPSSEALREIIALLES